MAETTPLLDRQRSLADAAKPPTCQARSPKSIVLLLSLLVFFVSCFGTLGSVPLTRLLEDGICRQYGARHARFSSVEERVCKADVVQSQLAYLNGLLETLEAVVGLLVAFPYGALSDRVGRRPVILLSIVGFTLASFWSALVLARGEALPMQAILFAPVFYLVGGGKYVAVSTLFSAVADVTTDDDRASAFVAISLGSFIGGVVGPVASSALMQVASPWLPFLLSYVFGLLGAAMLVFIPETAPRRKQDPADDEPADDEMGALVGWHVRGHLALLRESLAMLRQPSLGLLLVTFLAPVPMSTATNQFFVQYVSKRFGWSMASAGYLQSVRGAVNMLLLLAVLPGLDRVLAARAAAAKDRALARLSAVALTLGCLLMAGGSMPVVVGGLVVNTLGTGLAPLCRSLAAYLVRGHDMAKLQTLIGIAEASSSLFSGPALAAMLSAGMADRAGLWMGLPYLGLAAFLFLTTLPLFFLAVPPRPGAAVDDDDDSLLACPCSCCVSGDDCPARACSELSV